MSIRAMFVGNAPARAGAAVAKKETGDLAAAQRAEQELARAMLGEELPEPPPQPQPAPAPAQPAKRP
jgi:hypothetical protein